MELQSLELIGNNLIGDHYPGFYAPRTPQHTPVISGTHGFCDRGVILQPALHIAKEAIIDIVRTLFFRARWQSIAFQRPKTSTSNSMAISLSLH